MSGYFCSGLLFCPSIIDVFFMPCPPESEDGSKGVQILYYLKFELPEIIPTFLF